MSGVRVPQRPPVFQPVNINYNQCLQAFLIFTTHRLYFGEHSKTGWFWVNESPKRNPKTFFGLFHVTPVFIGYYCILSRFWGVGVFRLFSGFGFLGFSTQRAVKHEFRSMLEGMKSLSIPSDAGLILVFLGFWGDPSAG
jgi:hypothetical protein